MKKALIGFAVLVIFGIYSLGIRHQKPVIGKPASLTTTPTAPAASNSSSSNSAASNSSSSPSTSSNSSSTSYKDGTFKGSVADAYYGNVQVSATISSGKITNVKFLQYPDTHQTSVIINQQAMPYLVQEAIQAQNAKDVQIISGATFTSQAFQQSLQAALSQA